MYCTGLEIDEETQSIETKITDHDKSSISSVGTNSDENKKSTIRKYSEISQDERDRQTFWEVVHSVDSTNHSNKQQRANDTIPKHIPQDIRAAYSQMFINSLNSGDINQVQNFFRSFMTGPCQFSIQHKISKQYGIPRYLNAIGPDLFSHYAMGVFVSFPDLVVKLKNSYTIVSKEWSGSRIIMETEFFGSKLRNLPDYPWLPPVEKLADIYKETPLAGTLPGFKLPELKKIPGTATTIASAVGPVGGEHRTTIGATNTTAVTNNTAVSTTTTTSTGTTGFKGLAYTSTDECSLYTATTGTTSTEYTTTPPTSPLSVTDTPSISPTAAATTVPTIITPTTTTTKISHGKSTTQSQQQQQQQQQQYQQQQEETDRQADINRHGSVVFPESHPVAPPTIPLSFVDRLISHAQIVVKPEKLHMRGCITLYLDENNCMKHMVCAQSSVY